MIGSGRMPWNFQELRGFSEVMLRRGLVPSARLLSSEMVSARGEAALALRLEDGESVYSIKRLRLVYKRKLNWAEESIGAVSAQQEEAAILEAAPGSPLLLIRETTYDSERVPIEYSRSLLRGDRYTASVISVRNRTLPRSSS